MTAPGSPTRENPESEEPAVSASTVGLFAGLLLALVAATGGWGWLFLGALLGALGYVVGAHLEGRIDLSALLPGRSRG